jgi:polysaccharide biosynthesis transport protein
MPNLHEMTSGAAAELHGLTAYSAALRVEQPPKEMTIQDLFALLARRRVLIAAVVAVAIAAAVIKYANTTRMYKGSATIQVQKDSMDALSLNEMMGTNAPPADALESNITLQTQAQILQSETLAFRVIAALHLEDTADFQPRPSVFGWILGLFSHRGSPGPEGVALEESPQRRSRAVRVFGSNLKVKPMPGTRLISIEYLSSDPKVAAAVANSLVENLIDYNFETRQGATRKASGWLTNQLADLRRQSEELQSRVANMQRDSGMFSDGQADAQGRQQVYAPALDRLQQASVRLGEAKSARIMKGALYEAIKQGDPELISNLAGSGSLQGSSSGVSGSLALLQNLRQQEAQTQAQLNEMSAKFGPNYPRIMELQAGLAGTQRAIRDESGRIAARARNDYEAALNVERKDADDFEDQKKQAQTLNSKAIEYEITRQEAAQSRSLYENLLGRLKEADLVAGLRSSNIAPVDAARVPTKPAKPSLMLYAAAGVGGGIVLAIGAALFREATDHRIYDVSAAKAMMGGSLLAFVPQHNRLGRHERALWRLSRPAPRVAGGAANLTQPCSSFLIAQLEPHSGFTEALRSLRTAIENTTLSSSAPRLILITSSVPGEGKTSLSINLAAVHAQTGRRVLLVDTDLRTPTLGSRLGINESSGLSTLLLRDISCCEHLPARIPLDGHAAFDVIPAGPLPAYPTELLGSDEMARLLEEWSRAYDYIFLDSAPLLPVTDSALLSKMVDFTLVVARHNRTDLRSLQRTSELLRAQGVHRTGVVLNGIRAEDATLFRHYGYRQTAYYGGRISA